MRRLISSRLTSGFAWTNPEGRQLRPTSGPVPAGIGDDRIPDRPDAPRGRNLETRKPRLPAQPFGLTPALGRRSFHIRLPATRLSIPATSLTSPAVPMPVAAIASARRAIRALIPSAATGHCVMGTISDPRGA